MRSWKTPALLATMALSGLGTLFAQGPALPTASAPTPASESTVPASPVPAPDAAVSGSNYSEVVAPAPINEANDHSGAAPTYEAATEASTSNGAVQIHSSPATVSEYPAPAAESVVLPSAPAAPPACNCQGQGAEFAGPGYGAPAMGPGYGGYGPVPPAGPIYTYGSGSGVAAGVLTPISNSGGLHTRYPYYNYRAPWYYQGPPSLNVTIIW